MEKSIISWCAIAFLKLFAKANECEFVLCRRQNNRQALLQKLIEEAGEAAQAHEEDLVAELADLYEVIER